MSYVVLARKYRPRNFLEMTGQDHVVRALTHALDQKRLHHAYLFTGTRGVGKTTVSRILAKSLNCTGVDGQGDITAQPCGQCSACRDIDADRYVDYVELDAASNRSIDEVRDLIERAAYKPVLGRFKVFMIDEAHQLTKDAFNALLKTLEEPPSYLKFVLATTDPERMLPTVLSRCLQFNLRPMSPETVHEHLSRVLAQEGIESDEGSLRVLSQAARGSMRDALSLTDQAIAYCSGALDEDAVRAMLGLSGGSAALALLQALANKEGGAALQLASSLREQGQSPRSLLEVMAQTLQQVAIAQVDPRALSDGVPVAERDAILSLAAIMAPDEVQLLYSILLQGESELALMSDAHAAFVMVLLRYLAFVGATLVEPSPVSHLRMSTSARLSVPLDAVTGSQDRMQRPTAHEVPNKVSGLTAVVPSPESDSPANEVGLTQNLQDEQQAWDSLVRLLNDQGRISGLVRELAWQSQRVGSSGQGDASVWHLRVSHESLRGSALQDKLSEAVSAQLGHAVQLKIDRGEVHDCAALRDAAQREAMQKRAETVIRDDAQVRELLSMFPGARIVNGSIRPRVV